MVENKTGIMTDQGKIMEAQLGEHTSRSVSDM